MIISEENANIRIGRLLKANPLALWLLHRMRHIVQQMANELACSIWLAPNFVDLGLKRITIKTELLKLEQSPKFIRKNSEEQALTHCG